MSEPISMHSRRRLFSPPDSVPTGGLGVFIYSKLFWDMLAPELQRDYMRNIDIFPLPYLPDAESVCAYYHRETGLHGETKELFDTFVRFFEDYKRGVLWDN